MRAAPRRAAPGADVGATEQAYVPGAGLAYNVPSRTGSNQMYVAALDRIVLKNATTARAFANSATVRKAAITTRVLQLVHEVVRKRIHITKRVRGASRCVAMHCATPHAD